jgi:GH18 family chitinase
VLAAALALPACSAIGGPGVRALSVGGWFASWRAHPDSVSLEGVDDVFYAFATPTAEGALDSIPHPDRLRALVARGRADGFGVHLSVGGWNDGDDTAFETLAADSASRREFARSVASVVEEYGLAGVDIDWEHPDPGPSAGNFVALIRTVATALAPLGAELGISVAGAWAWGGDGIRPEVFDLVDRVHVMAYSGGYGPHHSSYRYARSAIDLYLDMGAPAAKLYLGVPFFGLTPDGDSKLYREILSDDPAAAEGDSAGAYYFNGEATLRRKVRLAAQEGLAGLIAWDLAADAAGPGSLLRVLVDEAK